jgi:hypothetical protein
VILFTHWLAISDAVAVEIVLGRLIAGILLYIAGFVVDFTSFPEYNCPHTFDIIGASH